MHDDPDHVDTYVVRVTGPAGDWQEWDMVMGDAGLTLDRIELLVGKPTRFNIMNHVQEQGVPHLTPPNVAQPVSLEDTQEWPRPLLSDEPHSKEENIAFRKDWDARVEQGKHA